MTWSSFAGKGSSVLHIVKEIDGDKLLIGNNLGRINGWATRADVIGHFKPEVADERQRLFVAATEIDLGDVVERKLVQLTVPGSIGIDLAQPQRPGADALQVPM